VREGPFQLDFLRQMQQYIQLNEKGHLTQHASSLSLLLMSVMSIFACGHLFPIFFFQRQGQARPGKATLKNKACLMAVEEGTRQL
jgi:hypothetical protein